MNVSKTVLVPYTPGEMYALVADVPSYPDFLPWCSRARVANEKDGRVRATIELAYGGLRHTFTTRNRMQPDQRIELQLVDGPFHRLEGYWRFEPWGERGCRVSLVLEYEFSNWLLTMTIAPVFTPIANSLVDAFHLRATTTYGKR